MSVSLRLASGGERTMGVRTVSVLPSPPGRLEDRPWPLHGRLATDGYAKGRVACHGYQQSDVVGRP